MSTCADKEDKTCLVCSEKGCACTICEYISNEINQNYPEVVGTKVDASKSVSTPAEAQSDNIDNVDIDRIIYVTEGPIDSLFLDNSVAVSNADLKKVSNYFPKDKLVLVFDNEPRNEEIVKIINKAIEDKFKVVIWPTFIKEKDINDMQLSKINYKELIKNNTYSGLTLQLNFNKWKRI